jgi:flagellar hook-associated protein FlgK
MADLLSIGLSGLSANKTSLAVTGHNITNVNTPGFSRQDTVQATRIPLNSSGTQHTIRARVCAQGAARERVG